tara:strand:+ start:8618 stop:9340 length:723 start_codon:yes stop_codon:yes gene_type:complete
MSNIIQSLWIGKELSVMEQLCLSSFVKNGHEVHLYTYGDVKNVPQGVQVKDGNDILSRDMIFVYREHKSYSGFSNYFRYKLLYEKGGYWVDTDQVCLKHFDFPDAYVFSSEEVMPFGEENQHINAGVIKAPKGNPVTKRAFDICMSKEKEKLVWGEIGPRLVKSSVETFQLQPFVKHFTAFCPIPGALWNIFLNPEVNFNFDDGVYGIHLWNEMWRRAEQDKNASYDPECLYEQLKRKFL